MIHYFLLNASSPQIQFFHHRIFSHHASATQMQIGKKRNLKDRFQFQFGTNWFGKYSFWNWRRNFDYFLCVPMSLHPKGLRRIWNFDDKQKLTIHMWGWTDQIKKFKTLYKWEKLPENFTGTYRSLAFIPLHMYVCMYVWFIDHGQDVTF
jgi:hypothetical protein